MSLKDNLNKILIIDFGSQFTQLIARRIRELGVYSEILSHKKIKDLKNIKNNTKGIIFSGGNARIGESVGLLYNIIGEESVGIGEGEG